MADIYKGLTIKIGAETTQLTSALNKAKKSVAGTSKELQQLNRALKVDPSNVALLAQKQDVYTRKIQASEARLKALLETQEQIGRENMTNEQWTKLQADIALTESDIRSFKEMLEDTKSTLDGVTTKTKAWSDKLGDAGEKAAEVGDKIRGIGDGMANIGDNLTKKVSAPIAAAAGASVAAAVDIDTALTSVRKTVDGTEEDYKRLKDAAIDYSRTHAVPADQMLELEALGAQLGFSIEELQKFGEVASGLDIATNMDAETASTEMAQFANITQMAHKDIDRYASSIVALGNNLATTEADVSHMAQRVAAASKQVGMTEADILGWSGAMTSLGINAEAGGTAFSTMVAQIDTAVAKGSPILEDYAKLAGVSADEFKKAWKEDASEAFQQMIKGLSTVENMNTALADIDVKNVRTVDMMKRLAGNTQLLGQALGVANDGWKQNEALATEVANKNASLAAKFEILKNRVTGVAAEVGEPLADALIEAVDAAEPLINVIEDGAKAFAEMDDEQQKMIISAAAAAASLGPLLSIAGRITSVTGGMVSGVGGAMKALGNFSDTCGSKVANLAKMEGAAGKLGTALGSLRFGPVVAGVAALTAVVGLGVAAWLDYQHNVEQTEKATKSLKDMTHEAEASVKNASLSIDDTTASAKNLTQAMEDTAEAADKVRDRAAKTAENFEKAWSNSIGESTMVNDYVDAIDELTSKSKLTATEQQRLKVAVDLYNDATGDSVKITNTLNGELSKTTEELYRSARAYEVQAKKAALQELMTESYKEQAEAEMKLKAANKELSAAQDELAQATDDATKGLDPYGYQVMAAAKKVEEAKGSVDELQAVVDSTNSRIEDATSSLVDLEKQQKKSDDNTKKLTDRFAQFGDGVKKSIEKGGSSVQGFAAKMDAAGIKSSDLKNLTAANFNEIYKSCGGNVEKMKTKIDEFNAKRMNKKTVEVDSSQLDRALLTAEQLRKELANGTIKGEVSLPKSSAKHAAGGIVTRSSMTSIGLVGEAGAEAIVPLTNARYVKPFAQAVAQQMSSSESNSTNYQVVLNGAVLNDSEAMRSTTQDFLTEIMRKAGMNRG